MNSENNKEVSTKNNVENNKENNMETPYEGEYIKLLERLISSNEINSKTNISLKASNEDVLNMTSELMALFEAVPEIQRDIFKGFDSEEKKRQNFLNQIPDILEINLSEETQQKFDELKSKIYKTRNLFYISLSTVLISFIFMYLIGNIGLKWYSESIKSKTELREEILNEIKQDGKIIYDNQDLNELKENTKLMQIWIKTNPKKAEDFLQFKNGYEAKENK